MVTVVPVGEAGQLPCVDPSTVNAVHSGAKWKWREFIAISGKLGYTWVHVIVHCT